MSLLLPRMKNTRPPPPCSGGSTPGLSSLAVHGKNIHGDGLFGRPRQTKNTSEAAAISADPPTACSARLPHLVQPAARYEQARPDRGREAPASESSARRQERAQTPARRGLSMHTPRTPRAGPFLPTVQGSRGWCCHVHAVRAAAASAAAVAVGSDALAHRSRVSAWAPKRLARTRFLPCCGTQSTQA